LCHGQVIGCRTQNFQDRGSSLPESGFLNNVGFLEPDCSFSILFSLWSCEEIFFGRLLHLPISLFFRISKYLFRFAIHIYYYGLTLPVQLLPFATCCTLSLSLLNKYKLLFFCSLALALVNNWSEFLLLTIIYYLATTKE